MQLLCSSPKQLGLLDFVWGKVQSSLKEEYKDKQTFSPVNHPRQREILSVIVLIIIIMTVSARAQTTALVYFTRVEMCISEKRLEL